MIFSHFSYAKTNIDSFICQFEYASNYSEPPEISSNFPTVRLPNNIGFDAIYRNQNRYYSSNPSPKTSKQSTIVDSRVRSTGLRVFGDGLEAPWVLPTAQVANFAKCGMGILNSYIHKTNIALPSCKKAL